MFLTDYDRWMFLARTALVPPMALAMIIYLAMKAQGSGSSFFQTEATVTGSEKVWLWLSSMTSITGEFSTLAVNIPDFSRFSKTPGAQAFQGSFIPFFKILVSVLGLIAGGATKTLYGSILWQPLDILAVWNTQGTGGRAASFFCASLWCLAQVFPQLRWCGSRKLTNIQICCNISANSALFGNDITSLCPKYFNICRGVLFAAVIGGWAMVPWIILSNATTFLNFVSAYVVFMARK